MSQPTENFYDAVGGESTFTQIARRFYEEVAVDDTLRPLYPEADLGPAEERFRLFLMQYWGGPRTYSDQRGHPRLRMRHNPFRIGPAERDAWLHAIGVAVAAVDTTTLDKPHRQQLLDYFEMAAHSMVNSPQ